MNKKLMAVAVAGALAVPGVVQAQSSVRISGVFTGSYEYYKIDNAAIGRLNNSQWRVTDDSSKLFFNVQEDLGGGLSAIAQLDQRFFINTSVGSVTSSNIASGNTWVGLRSRTLGTLTIGRHSLHYYKTPQESAPLGGALGGMAVTLVDYGSAAGKAATGMYNISRSQNSLKYTSPNLYGITTVIGYTSSGNASFEAGDMVCAGGAAKSSCTTAVVPGVNNRKGSGWNINPEYRNGPVFLGYSYLRYKPDLVATTSGIDAGLPGSYATAGVEDKLSNQIYGLYSFPNFHIGGIYNQSKKTNSNTGLITLKRTSWAIPASYAWGPHHIAGVYAKNGNNTGPAGEEANTGATMQTISYIYDFSKRTSVALTYSKINNDSNAAYNIYTSTSYSSKDVAGLSGEKPQIFAFTVKHLF